MPQVDRDQFTFWTIGHGRLEGESLIDTLRQHGITSVVDVRSTPSSARSPQFNAPALKRELRGAGIAYVPMGVELGGRPPETRFYDDGGHVLYRHLAASPRFQAGIARLLQGATRYRVALLCSESDPTRCHRNLLIGRVLRQQGHSVIHIMPGGESKKFDDRLIAAVGLPGIEEDPWRSLVQVRQDPQRKSSFEE